MTRLSILIVVLAAAAVHFGEDESREPSREYTLEIDGKAYQLTLDQPVQIEGSFENPEVILGASPVRLFTLGGVEFLYPAYFAWEADLEEPGFKSWTLSGNDFVIMFFESVEALGQEAYAEIMTEQFGRANVRRSGKGRSFGGLELDGVALRINLAGVPLTMEIFEIPSESGSRLLVLQDAPPEKAKSSEEGTKAVALLEQSFKDRL